MTTDRERFRATMALVDKALDLPPAERDAMLERECADPALREGARRLLEADARAGDFLAEPAAAPQGRATEGALVGPFCLVAPIGKGGMGEVWVAERAGADFEQRVAVKLLPPAPDEASIARFRRERQILARLTHPHIAQLLDGGVTSEGRPWLAMELVDGVGLMEHCIAHDLDVDARLKLFVDICGAVQFAHQNLVVHRDLKPSNILVTPSGEPKLLDFGIAKLLEGDDGDETALTRTNERPMTLDYAAPEQVRGDPVTTASDVWSLGVILHELLAGVRPYRATGKNRVETEQAILAAEPSRPSAHVEDADAQGRPKEGSLRALRRRLRGDLDAIVLKAMRGDPAQRYVSAASLGADVRRHLDGAPVAARGDATRYVVRALVRRHRVAFTFTAVVLLSLVGGLVGTLWQARRAREEARRAEQAQSFLVSMLRAFDPEEAGGKPVTQRDILARGEARLGELDDQPEVQGHLLQVFAETWYDIEDYDHARSAADRALVLERRTTGPKSIEVTKTLVLIGDIEFQQGEFTDASQSLEEGLALARSLEGTEGLTVAGALNDLAGVKRRLIDFPEAEKLRRQSLEIYRKRLGEEDPTTLGVMNDLAVLLGDEGRFAESAALQGRTCDLMAKVRGAAHPDTLICRTNLARDLIELGRAADADAVLVTVYDDQVRVLGQEWADIPNTEQMRGRALDAMGRPAQAIPLFDDALARSTKQLGADHPDVASILAYKALALAHLGRIAEAEDVARRALAAALGRLGEEHAYTARARFALGTALLAAGKPRDAQAELRSALSVQEAHLGPNHADTVRTRALLAKADAAAK